MGLTPFDSGNCALNSYMMLPEEGETWNSLWRLGAHHEKKGPCQITGAGMAGLANPSQTLSFIYQVFTEPLTLCFLVCKVRIVTLGRALRDKALGTRPGTQ